MQTVHLPYPSKMRRRSLPRIGSSRPRLPFAPCGAQCSSIELNSCKPPGLRFALGSRAMSSANAVDQSSSDRDFARKFRQLQYFEPFCVLDLARLRPHSPPAYSHTNAIMSECGNGQVGSRSSARARSTPTSSATSRARHCSSDSPGSTKPASALYMPGGKWAAREEDLAFLPHQGHHCRRDPRVGR